MSIKQLPSGIEVRIRQDLSEGSRGDTTLIIDPIITKSGHRVTMDDIGIRGFGKIDANNPREEIISWTGITDNGTTYTLTGVVWGINFHNSTGNFTDNMKRHISGAKFSINTDMHYIADNYVNKREFNVNDNSIGWGDGTKDENKVLEARNGTANLPFIVYNETVNKWLISNDGINTYDILAGDSGLEAGVATLINAGKIDVQVGDASGVQVVDNKIKIVYQTNPGLEVNTSNELGVKIKEGTGLIKDADGLWCDSIDPDNILIEDTPGKLIGGEVDVSLELDVLMVAGGGGSGYTTTSFSNRLGGGGGAGGLILRNNFKITELAYSVVIGAGGNGSPDPSQQGQNGGDTTFGTLTAKGGGGGGSPYVRSGSNGGSGGGAGCDGTSTGTGGEEIQTAEAGDSGAFGYGNNGANSISHGPAGGGGAGGAGGKYGQVKYGGDGLEVFGEVYAKGGAADEFGDVARENMGDGGRGVSKSIGGSGNGSAGVVIIRYKTSLGEGLTITGGTKTTEGDYTYHKFTENGTFLVSSIPTSTQLQNLIDLGAGTNNGKITINIDGVNYENLDIDLSGVNSYGDVAERLQSAIRSATGKTETVLSSGDNFTITSSTTGKTSKVLKLTPPSSGTDITGVNYLNLSDNATEVFGDSDNYKIVRLNGEKKIPKALIPSDLGKNITSQTRQNNFIYQNTGSEPIIIYASFQVRASNNPGAYGQGSVYLGETAESLTEILRVRKDAESYSDLITIPLSFIVPPGYYYKYVLSQSDGVANLIFWKEQVL